MDIISQLKRDEGTSQFPYKDTAGKLTIGVGRNLSDVGLYPDEIDYLLTADVARVRAALSRNIGWFGGLDVVRQSALINMGFNLGVNGLLGFPNMLAAFAREDWNDAANEMLDSMWAKQVGDRAQRLATQIKTGQWV